MSLLTSNTKGALLLSLAGFLTPAVQAQLANDECTGAITVIDGANGPFDTTGATTSSPAWPCASGGNDLWYVYSASCTGTVTVDTCGGGFDTAIQVFDSTCAPCPNFVSGPCNDDSCGLQSSVNIAAAQGTILYIRVGGFVGRVGQFPLNILCTPGGGPSFPDDECSGATPVTFGLTTGLDNLNYTTSAPSWPCAGGGSDRWFVFTPACPGTYTFTTCTAGRGYDTAMELFQGPCSPCGMTSLVCNDDTGGTCGLGSTITQQLLGGVQYFLRVGGFNSAQGTFELEITASGNGSFAVASPGCGGTTITATGSPNIGGAVNFTMTPVQGVAQIWIGLFPLNVPLCSAGCALGTTFDAVFGGNVIASPIPCDPTIVGAQVYTQGLDLGAAGGCTVLDPLGIPFTLSDTILTTIGS